MHLIIIILCILSVIIIWQFVGYPLLMGFIALKVKTKNKDYYFKPFVSIVVPTYNEETVIKERIDNLLSLDYPKDKYEVIVVDSASVDKTTEIMQRILKKHGNSKPSLKLIKEEKRKGKASAINQAKNYAEGEIVCVTDANSIFDKNVLKETIPYFKNPKVGAVGGCFVVKNPQNSIENSTQFYWDIEYLMRMGESVIDSACLFHGEINIWRKNIVEADEKSLSEDLDMVLKIRKQGYKIVYEPKAIVYEPAASNISEQIKQRKRTSIGTIQNIFKHWKYLIIPADLYRLVIFPSHKGIVMLSPFIFLAVIMFYIVSGSILTVLMHLFCTLCLFFILFISLIVLMSKIYKKSNVHTNNQKKISFRSMPKIVFYVLLNEYLILLAWRDFVFKRYKVSWEKAESTRS